MYKWLIILLLLTGCVGSGPRQTPRVIGPATQPAVIGGYATRFDFVNVRSDTLYYWFKYDSVGTASACRHYATVFHPDGELKRWEFTFLDAEVRIPATGYRIEGLFGTEPDMLWEGRRHPLLRIGATSPKDCGSAQDADRPLVVRNADYGVSRPCGQLSEDGTRIILTRDIDQVEVRLTTGDRLDALAQVLCIDLRTKRLLRQNCRWESIEFTVWK